MEDNGTAGRFNGRTIALFTGPLAALILIFFIPLDPDNALVSKMAAVALWMAIWWISEAAPLAVTALLPVAGFPILGIMSGKETAPLYFNHIIFLFIGGFIIALAMQRWDLHKRIALLIVRAVGVSQARLILGFMIATAFLSMWISNTATTMMMVPIALAVIYKLEDGRENAGRGRFGVGLLLGVAYSASIGGLATLVGTPPNLSFTRILTISFDNAPEISFTQWTAFALPLSIVMLAIAWLYLVKLFSDKSGSGSRKIFDDELSALGRIGGEEKQVLAVFAATAILWLTRSKLAIGGFTFSGWALKFEEWGWITDAGYLNDGTVAITLAILLFLLPARNGGRLMRWEDTAGLPWGIVLLFGGGFALASGFKASGLSVWCGEQLSQVGSLHPVLIVLIVCLVITFLTELTSNTATTEMILPILAAVAANSEVQLNPLLLMVPATLSASCAFMLPVATPPNAIIFGSNRISIATMARTGLALNLIGAVLITAAVFLLGRFVLGIELGVMPDWAVMH